MTLALIAIGNTYNQKKDYKIAIGYYQQAEVLAKKIGVDYQLSESFDALAQSFARISEFEQAYHYQKLLSEIKEF